MEITSAPSQAMTSVGQAPVRLRMSFEEFLDWEHAGIAEWVDGEVFQMAVKYEHQLIVDFLNRLIGFFIVLMNAGILKSAPYVMRAIPGGPAREPDLMFVAKENIARVTSSLINGPADLVIEVVSEESAARDRSEKFDEYEDAGVREYWIIDSRPNRQRADFYVLDANGRYRPVLVSDDGIYRSTVLEGFWLDVKWLWQKDPNPLSALAHVVGPDKLIEAIRADS